MKASVSFAGLLPLFLSACLPLMPESGSREAPPPVADTSIYLSAVCYPDSVDWRNDSLMTSGSVATLVLFRNFEPVLVLETGPRTAVSPEYDLHHLVGGALYTEYSDNAHTVIGRNGKELFRYQGREVLVGIVPDTSGVYTLGRSRSGEGFSLRRDGRCLYRSADGEPVGPLQLEDGLPTFGFRRFVGGEAVEFFFDGHECAQLPRADGEFLLDIRLKDGVLYRLNQDSDGNLWFCSSGVSTRVETDPACRVLRSSELCEYAGRPAVTLNGNDPGGRPHIWVWQDGKTVLESYAAEGYYYSDGSSWGIVDEGSCYVSATGSSTEPLDSFEDSYFFRKDCAFFKDGRFLLALTPKMPPEPAMVMRSGKDEVRVEINGALTAVELVVSDPR